MFEIAREQGQVKDRDEMRKLPKDVQSRNQELAAKKIAEMAQTANIILDTHCTIKTPKGYLPGIPRNVLDLLKPTQFILVEAGDKEIYARRQKDDTRKRDEDSVEQIHEHQMINRYYGAAYSAASGALLAKVENHDGELKEAIRQMLELLK
jgi:adenylate kinase